MTRIWQKFFTFEASNPHPRDDSAAQRAHRSEHTKRRVRHRPPAEGGARIRMFRQRGADLVFPGEVGELDEDAANASIRARQQDRLADPPRNCPLGGPGETSRHKAGVRGVPRPITLNTCTTNTSTSGPIAGGTPAGHPCFALSPPAPLPRRERVTAAISPRGGRRDPLRDVTPPPGTGVSPATADAADAAGKKVNAHAGGVRDHVRRTPGSGAGRARARGRRGG